MSCCRHFSNLMEAYTTRGEQRARAEAAEAEVRRLHGLLARVGVHDTEGHQPPDTRPACAPLDDSACDGRATLAGMCSAHYADEVLP